MTLETEDIVPVPTLLEDIICLLEEHRDKLASAAREFDCKLELEVKSPLPCTLEKCAPSILSFAKDIGATITIL